MAKAAHWQQVSTEAKKKVRQRIDLDQAIIFKWVFGPLSRFSRTGAELISMFLQVASHNERYKTRFQTRVLTRQGNFLLVSLVQHEILFELQSP